MRISGNKVLITGATAGIGEALTKKFVSLDNKVIAVGRNEKKLAELTQEDKRIIPFRCDISQPNDLDKLIMFVEQNHSDTNILVNNAGIQFNYDFAIEPQLLGKIEQEVKVNFLAPLQLISLMLPMLKNNDNAAIVNVSSGLGLVPKKQAPVYCGTKAGIHIFSKALRYQLKHTKVFEIIPPLVDTQMTAGRGKDKISTEQLAEEFVGAFKKDKYEVSVGKISLLKLINRISPTLADKIMKNGGER
ncbi:MAG: SDR family NAD(P)-dependent oxidoreductase [Ekhidna sp.]|nr:SDR family NAD(P)-dependent oxidoreductase [Ekhidna sp.]